jgi:DNA ligase 1
MLLTELVDTSNAVQAASGRLDKTARIAALLTRLAPDEIEIAVTFLSGAMRQGRVGIGWAAIRAAASTPAAETPSITLHDVDRTLGQIASARGGGSSRARAGLLTDLLSRATRPEQDFLVRLLHGELRQGALEGVMVDAVAKAAGAPPASLRRAVMMAGDLASVARAVIVDGEPALARFAVQLLRPVQPMLAESAVDLEEALRDAGDPLVEQKLDGARIQVHKAGDLVRVYSRGLREVTPAVPEVVEAAAAFPARDVILDGEVIVLRPDGTPVPFQDTMRRFGRRLDVNALRQQLPLSPFFFDLLALDGRDVLDEPQAARFTALQEVVPAPLVIPHASGVTAASARAFLDGALARGHEGVMAKSRGAPYAAGNRGSSWLKVKAVRTLDLVVLAVEWGSGRRKGWLSNLHLGARDPATGGFVMLGKTFKGMTDALLAWQTRELLAREVARDEYVVYVRPELVVEIAFNDLQASPHYPGGLALRFARVKRYRTDKTAEQADTIETVRDVYRQGHRA